MKTVIIGGVAGGASCAARLRRLDEKSEIIMLEKGGYISFANCGLPYYVGDTIREEAKLSVMTPKAFSARFNVDVRPYNEAVKINRAEKTVTVRRGDGSEYVESYDKLVYSPGAVPNVPSYVPASDRIFTVRTIPDAANIKNYVNLVRPQTAIVAGSGFIGLEMAENLTDCGVKVTVIGRSNHVLSNVDEDVAWDIHKHLKSCGLALVCGAAMTGVKDEDGKITVTTSKGDITADMLIMAVGVKPDSSLAVECGLACDKQGYVLTDAGMLTSDENIYALGDACTIKDFQSGEDAHVALAGPANWQARIVADRLCGIESSYKGSQRSFIIKLFNKTVAATGMSEKYARSLGIDCEKVHLYQANHATYYPGADMLAVKLLFDKKDGKVLGGQFFGGEGTDKRADVLATAIRAGMTVYDLEELELCYAPPFSSAKDPVKMGAMAAENILTGKVSVYHWENLDKLYDMDVTLLDVRNEAEYEKGAVKGFKNIPLPVLREHLDEIDKSKPVYVHCLSGMRSYVACRILTGHGFDCYNISGGYRLYKIMDDFKNER